jgi:hypothetical protein
MKGMWEFLNAKLEMQFDTFHFDHIPILTYLVQSLISMYSRTFMSYPSETIKGGGEAMDTKACA